MSETDVSCCCCVLQAEAKGKRDSLAAQLEAELVVKRRELGVAEDASGAAKEEL